MKGGPGSLAVKQERIKKQSESKEDIKAEQLTALMAVHQSPSSLSPTQFSVSIAMMEGEVFQMVVVTS